MEPYPESIGVHAVLDFTSAKRDQAGPTETPVLDLSCKKQSTAAIITESITYRSRSNSPATTEEQEETVNVTDSSAPSPFEGRTFMVTPPSESDSPKKLKYEAIYNAANALTNIGVNQHAGYAALPMNISMPVPPAALPTLLAQNAGPAKPIQMVGASVTSTTTSTTYCNGMAVPASSADASKKAPRPFKAYPKDPLTFNVGTAELMYDQNTNEAYSEFRKRMLDSVRRSNEGTNIKMRRVAKSPVLPTSTVDEKDAAYWERRRKNNEAAKRSRDARRAKEDEIAIRAAFLEQENMKLKYELVALRNETAKLRCMVYTA